MFGARAPSAGAGPGGTSPPLGARWKPSQASRPRFTREAARLVSPAGRSKIPPTRRPRVVHPRGGLDMMQDEGFRREGVGRRARSSEEMGAAEVDRLGDRPGCERTSALCLLDKGVARRYRGRRSPGRRSVWLGVERRDHPSGGRARGRPRGGRGEEERRSRTETKTHRWRGAFKSVARGADGIHHMSGLILPTARILVQKKIALRASAGV